MADALQLMTYESVSGPVAYDQSGRTFCTRKDGERLVPIGLNIPHVFVDAFFKSEGKGGGNR